MWLSPILYTFIFCFSFLLRDSNLRKIFYKSLCIILILIIILLDKSNLPDYFAYVSYFTTDYLLIEPTFIIIRRIIKLYSNDVIWLFSIYAVLGVGLKFIAFKKLTPLLFLTVAIYIASYWTYHELIQIRAGVAAGILLLSIKPLYEKKLTFFGIVLIASLFHASAVSFFPLWFIRRKSNLDYVIYLTIIPLSMLLYLIDCDLIGILKHIPISFIQDKIIGYANVNTDVAVRGVLTPEEYNPFITWYIIKVLICYLLWLYNKDISKKNKYFLLLLKIYTIGISFLWFLGGVPTIATRISELFGIVQILIIPMLIFARLPKYVSYGIIYIYGLIWIIWNINSFF